MRPAVVEAPLPRADVGAVAPGGRRRWFAFGDAHLGGLHFVFWALLLYVFLSLSVIDEEWKSIARFRPRLVLGSILLAAAAVRILRGAIGTRRGPAPPHAPAAWWSVYLVVTLLATVWAYDFGLARTVLLDGRLASLLMFALIATTVRTRREFLVLVLVFCLGIGFFLLRSFHEYMSGRYMVAQGVKRMLGAGRSNSDPNSFAATIVFALPLVLWAGIHTRSGLLRFCVAGYGALTALAVVLTRSRAGLVLLGLTAFWFVIALPNRKARAIGVVLLVLVAFAVGSQVSERAWARYLGMFTGGVSESERKSTEGRIRGYEVAFEILGERPVLGVGPGNWAIYRSRRIDGDTLMPHSLTGQLLATLGIAGTVTFVGYLLSTVLFARREARRRKGSVEPWDRAVRSFTGAMVFTLILLFVSGLAAHNLGRSAWFWAPALLVVACTCRREDDVPVEPAP